MMRALKLTGMVLGLGVVTLAAFPYSVVPALLIVAVVVYRRSGAALATRPASPIAVYEAQLRDLEDRLEQHVRETELLTRIRYTEWKIRQEKDRQHYLRSGIRFPKTGWDSEQDAIFYQLERRIEEEQRRFEDEARRIEREERWRLDDEQRRQLALEDHSKAAAIQAQQAELARARMAAECQAAETIAKALRADLT